MAQQDKLALARKVADRRRAGESIRAIADDLGMHPTAVVPLYDSGKVGSKQALSKAPDPATVRKLRDTGNLTWSEIAGRYVAGGQRASIASVKKLYAQAPAPKPARKRQAKPGPVIDEPKTKRVKRERATASAPAKRGEA